jgi:hypothetical protein
VKRQTVSSSNIKSIGHENDVLEVEFSNGGIYHYHGVPVAKFHSLKGAKSIGGYLHQHIKPKYKSVKVEPRDQASKG